MRAMATYMPPVASTAERRKKSVKYGKSSRRETAQKSILDDNAPSLERTHIHPTAAKGALKRLGENLQTESASVSGSSKPPDIFDVPSDDEFLLPANKHVSTILGKERKFGTNHTLQKPNRQVLAIPESTSQQPPTRKLSHQPIPASRNAQNRPKIAQLAQNRKTQFSVHESTTLRTSGRIPHSKLNTKAKDARSGFMKETDSSRKTADKFSKPVGALSKKVASGKPPVRTLKPTQSLDLKVSSADLNDFDFPFSDDDSLGPVLTDSSKLEKKPPQIRDAMQAQAKNDENKHDESDDSNTSRKRKRRGSPLSIMGVEPRFDGLQESSMPQRSRKLQRTTDSLSTTHDRTTLSPVTAKPHVRVEIPLNKPKRTRIRTVPVLTHINMVKGQSAPATLHSMLPAHNPVVSPTKKAPHQTSVQEDETMYNILHAVVTPSHASRHPISGSVTPRQKALFQDLLSSPSSSTTPVPNIASLQLTDRQPKSLIGVLAKSKSNLADSPRIRKTQLISTLKCEESNSDSEDSDTSYEEGSEGHALSGSSRQEFAQCHDIVNPSQEMELAKKDSQPTGELQATQSSGRPKSTYAKARSYLQELNPEDAFLMSMDLDDSLGLDSQQQADLDDEDEQTSQVKGRHELRATGQQSAISMEIEMSIDDISSPSNAGVRRTAMMDICSKLADKSFASQLLESSLAQRLLKNMTSKEEVVFDFTSAAAVVFMLDAQPTYAILELVYRSEVVPTLEKLLEKDKDVQRIAKDRKTNLSIIAQTSVTSFRTLVQNSSAWQKRPERISPRLLALKSFESLILGLRGAGDFEAAFSSEIIMKLIDIASISCSDGTSNKDSLDNGIILELVFSTLESLSLAKQKQSIWSSHILERLAGLLSTTLKHSTPSTFMLAIKLCMNVTNTKPKACRQFSGSTFVQCLTSAIVDRFHLLESGVQDEERTATQETLILSLGALINLAELSDAARKMVDDGHGLLDSLVEIFVQGADQAAQAESIEESQYSVAIGYLSVLLGNLCLNKNVRSRIRALLPEQRFDRVLSTINDFIRFYEHVDDKNGQFEGEEGQEALQNYTARLRMVVQKLEEAST